MGDLIMTSPAIKALRGDGRKITLLTSASGAMISPYITSIDKTVVYNLPWAKHEKPLRGDGLNRMVEDLKKQNFDAAIVFTVFSQNPLPSALITYMAGIPLRAAYCRENPWDLLTDWVFDPEPQQFIRHEVQRQLELVSNLGFEVINEEMDLEVPAGAYTRARSKLISMGINLEKDFLVVHPGVSEAKRQYDSNCLANAVKEIQDKWSLPILLTGVESERKLAQKVKEMSGDRAINLAGSLELDEFMAVVKRASLLISNNSGPVHIASALKTKVLDLYALTNPQHTPWRVNSEVLYFDVDPKYKKTVISDKIPFGSKKLIGYETIAEAAGRLLNIQGGHD